MHYNKKRGLAVALCACLSFSALTGCSKKSNEPDQSATMFTVGDETLSAGTANLIMRYQQAEFDNFLGNFLRSYYGVDDIWNADLYGTGEAYGNTFKQEVEDTIQHMLLAKGHAAEYGVELFDEDKKEISAAAADFISANSEETLAKLSATTETVEEMLTLYTIQNRMEEAMSADVDTNVTDEEAAQRTVSYISFTAQTEAETEEESEELSETAIEEDLEEAETIVAEAVAEAESEIKTGSANETEVPEEGTEGLEAEAPAEAESETEVQTEPEDPAMIAARLVAMAKAERFLQSAREVTSAEEFDELADQTTAEDTLASSGSWTFGADDTYPDASIITATEGLDDNTLVDQVFQVGTLYYVVYVADAFDEEATEDKKEDIVQERKDARIEELYGEWEESAEITIDDAAYAALALDFILAAPEQDESELDLDFEELSEADTDSVLIEELSEVGTESAAE